jgi:subtilisin family serine protease
MGTQLVTADKLNIRNSPKVDSTFANWVGDMNRGETFTAVNTVKGDMIDGVDDWHVDALNRYVWAGGATNLPTDFDVTKMSWGHQYYNIPGIWHDLNTGGQNVTVAVIDTGADQSHPDLIDNIITAPSKDWTGGNNPFNDQKGHGTQMAGMIAASGKSLVYGVSPAASLIILKASTFAQGLDAPNFVPAIQYATSLPQVDIISISYSFFDSSDQSPIHPVLPQFIQAVKDALGAGKMVVAAIGDIHQANPDPDTYPSSITNVPPDTSMVLSIGSFEPGGNVWKHSQYNDHLCFLVPGDDNMLTTQINNTTAPGSDTSIATAFTSGCLALLLSYARRNQINQSDLLNAIHSTCVPLPNPPNPALSFGWGKLDLQAAITKLKAP